MIEISKKSLKNHIEFVIAERISLMDIVSLSIVCAQDNKISIDVRIYTRTNLRVRRALS